MKGEHPGRSVSIAHPGRSVSIYLARCETRSFTFEAADFTEALAVAALKAGMREHRAQYSLPVNWHTSYDIEVSPMLVGAAFRDGEVLP